MYDMTKEDKEAVLGFLVLLALCAVFIAVAVGFGVTFGVAGVREEIRAIREIIEQRG